MLRKYVRNENARVNSSSQKLLNQLTDKNLRKSKYTTETKILQHDA